MKKIILILFVIIFTQSAFAQEIALGPIAGYFKTSDADEGALIFGGAVRLKLSDAFGVEGSFGYRQEEYENGLVKVTSYPIMATGMIYVLPMIYGAAGAGWYNFNIEYASELGLDDDTTQEFGYHLGGGVELPLGNLILRGDIRYVFLNLELDNLPSAKDLKSDFYVITAGLLFTL